MEGHSSATLPQLPRSREAIMLERPPPTYKCSAVSLISHKTCSEPVSSSPRSLYSTPSPFRLAARLARDRLETTRTQLEPRKTRSVLAHTCKPFRTPTQNKTRPSFKLGIAVLYVRVLSNLGDPSGLQNLRGRARRGAATGDPYVHEYVCT